MTVELREENEELREKLDGLRELWNNARDACRRAETKRDELAKENKELRASLQLSDQSLEVASGDAMQFKADLEELRKENELFREDLSGRAKSLEKAVHARDELMRELEEARVEIKQLLDGPDSERLFWDTFIKGVEIDFADCHSDPGEYSQRINDIITKLQEELEKLREENDELQERVKWEITKRDAAVKTMEWAGGENGKLRKVLREIEKASNPEGLKGESSDESNAAETAIFYLTKIRGVNDLVRDTLKQSRLRLQFHSMDLTTEADHE